MLPVSKTTKSILSLAAGISLAIGMSGCSEIIPGLNVHVGSGEQHAYKIAANDDGTGYKVAPASPTNYEIVTIGPDTIAAAATQPEEDEADPLPSILPSDVPPEYKIGPGDIIYITVWEHPELTSPFTGSLNDSSVPAIQGRLVAADGTVFYPYVGTFKVAGSTAGEFRDYLTAHLHTVLTDPQIDVRVVAFRSRRIEVTGEVARPGTITLDDTPKGVLQAIAASGGLTPTASRRRIILVRGGHTHVIDLSALISGSRPIANPQLEPGDVIHVPDQSGDQVFVLGAVNKQQPLVLQQDAMSLIQAISQAGGLDRGSAKESGVFVFRGHRAGSGFRTTVYTLDFSHPADILLAGEFKLQPHDVVYVQATKFYQYNTVINQLLPTVEVLYELNYLHQIIPNN